MLKIYNTLGRELQEFKSLEKGKVKFYQCGPTVYSRQHIGNMFAAVKGDLIRRSLQYLGYEVNFVRNVTDVGHLVSDEDEGEDKMAKGVRIEGSTPEMIAKKYLDLYHQDIHKLNVMDPTTETIATEYVMQMADMVQELLDKGYAYVTESAIYFEVDKFPDYNKLNLQKLDENKLGEGHGDVSDESKKKPYDFALWFFKTGVHANSLQTWNHKFSGIEQSVTEGFPGWHIECSVMAKDTLGEQLDLHMGGIEHIPTHHTNEIAQSESANGKKYVNYWLHHEMLEIAGGKMAKSLGNGYFLDDLEAKGFSAADYRYFLLQAHYRSKQNFTWESLEASQKALSRLKNYVKEWVKETSNQKNVKFEIDESLKTKFIEALENDFNISKALSIVWDMIKLELPSGIKLTTLLDFDRVFVLDVEEWINTPENEDIPVEAKILIEERNIARINKDWKKSDELRDRLKEEFGIELKDK